MDTKGLVRDTVSLTDTLAVADTTSFGNLPWRSVFTDPQLQTLIQQGLDNNIDLLNAALNVHMVSEALKVAKARVPALCDFFAAGYALVVRRGCCHQELHLACLGRLEHRPLRQSALSEAFCPDAGSLPPRTIRRW